MGTKFLRAFLNLLWLRPESAILCACHAQVLNSYLAARSTARLAELCCGDGTFSFILHGGRFVPEWDAFQATNRYQQRSGKGCDIFDHFDQSYRPQIARPAVRPVSLGVDLRKSMLQRAETLGLYQDLRTCDLALPVVLEQPGFDTVLLLQSINHIPNAEQAARNLYAAMSSGGVAYVTTYDPSFCEFYGKLDRLFTPEWVSLVERSMRQAWPVQLSVKEWAAQFRKAGFRDIQVVPLLSRNFAPVWNVGMRPIAPLLIRMAELARAQDGAALAEIKAEWIALFQELAAPFVEPAAKTDEAGTHLYILSRA